MAGHRQLKLTNPDPPIASPASYMIIREDANIGSGRFFVLLQADTAHQINHAWTGQEALDFIAELDAADCSVKSRTDRILERLSADGVAVGTVEDVT